MQNRADRCEIEHTAEALVELQEKAALAEREKQAWMKTAQRAEEWADQLDKIRFWLQAKLLARSLELKQWKDAHQQKERALADLAALQEQIHAANKALEQKRAELAQLECQRRPVEQVRSMGLWRRLMA